ncbi:MAG TPA: alcohol dehydrogenase catalytic domain-containing protein [Mycobacteriales bacterium]|nr:alcohol dehydrogenase catalytic domain-containing protein [Mycobacteriales bacterium]
MRAVVYHGPRDVRVEQVPDASVQDAGDVVVRVLRACICGSDLWSYRGYHPDLPSGLRTGHEFLGVVEDAGRDVRALSRGDLVLAPFYYCDGTCEYCRAGLTTSCTGGGGWGGTSDGGQGEAVRVPHADATLVAVPGAAGISDAMLTSLLPLTDVMSTGHHACVSAGVGQGSSVAVIGDGAVGLCAVLAAARLGAERIIAVGHHEDRLEVATLFGATDVVTARGEEAVAAVRELTDGGVQSVCECVGNQSAVDTALGAVRDGGRIGWVGVPADVTGFDMRAAFGRNVSLTGGVAPARDYIPELMADVLAGRLDPSPVLDLPLALDDAADGYRRMDERTAIKVMLTP